MIQEMINWTVVTLCYGICLLASDLAEAENFYSLVGFVIVSLVSGAILLNLTFVGMEIVQNLMAAFSGKKDQSIPTSEVAPVKEEDEKIKHYRHSTFNYEPSHRPNTSVDLSYMGNGN